MPSHVDWKVFPFESVVEFLSSSTVGGLRRIHVMQALYIGLVYGVLGGGIGLQSVLDGERIRSKCGLTEDFVVGLKGWLLVSLFAHV